MPTALEALDGARLISSSLPPWVGLRELGLSIKLAKATGDPCPVGTTVAVNPSTKTITGTIPREKYRLTPVGFNISPSFSTDREFAFDPHQRDVDPDAFEGLTATGRSLGEWL